MRIEYHQNEKELNPIYMTKEQLKIARTELIRQLWHIEGMIWNGKSRTNWRKILWVW